MSKRYDLSVDHYQAASFLNAIRTKRDIVALWMNTIKSFLVNQPAPPSDEAAKLTLLVSSMSRLFCASNGGAKIFSVAFPFTIRNDENALCFYSREGVPIDSDVSSQILALMGNEPGESCVLSCTNFENFVDPLLSIVDGDPSLWSLFREMMLAEDAYVRYDHDATRAQGDRHPLHHLDLFYSSSSSFKLGLDAELDQATLASILDVETDCHYIRTNQRR